MNNTAFKALAHPVRRRILSLLKGGPKASGELAAAFDIAWPTVTRHLNTLRDADLITAERDANSILYRVNVSVLEEAAAAILALVGAQAEDDDETDDGPPNTKEAAE